MYSIGKHLSEWLKARTTHRWPSKSSTWNSRMISWDHTYVSMMLRLILDSSYSHFFFSHICSHFEFKAWLCTEFIAFKYRKTITTTTTSNLCLSSEHIFEHKPCILFLAQLPVQCIGFTSILHLFPCNLKILLPSLNNYTIVICPFFLLWPMIYRVQYPVISCKYSSRRRSKPTVPLPMLCVDKYRTYQPLIQTLLKCYKLGGKSSKFLFLHHHPFYISWLQYHWWQLYLKQNDTLYREIRL